MSDDEIQCERANEKTCHFGERMGVEPGQTDCIICVLFEISDVLMSIWGEMGPREGVNQNGTQT